MLKFITFSVMIPFATKFCKLQREVFTYEQKSSRFRFRLSRLHRQFIPATAQKNEFHLDGNINKPFWEDAPYTDEFLDIQGSHMPLPRFVTHAKMLWDDENLYVAADLAGDEIWGHLTERDSVIYFDNDFEIFVDPDSDTYHYYEFEMNVLNTVWDLFLAEPYRDGGSGLNGYDMHGLRTAVHVDGSINDPSAENKGWSVEVVIPFSALYEYQKERRAPKNGEFYRMNFSRVQWNVDVKDNTYVKRTDENGNVLPEDNWVWAPTGVINIHYPELWAFVFFSEDREDAPCDSTIPEDEYRKWELRKLYYAENILFETTGSYSSSLDELQKTLDAYAPNDWNKSVKDLGYTIETTSRTYLISCPSADRAHLLLLYSNGKVEKITL